MLFDGDDVRSSPDIVRMPRVGPWFAKYESGAAVVV